MAQNSESKEIDFLPEDTRETGGGQFFSVLKISSVTPTRTHTTSLSTSHSTLGLYELQTLCGGSVSTRTFFL